MARKRKGIYAEPLSVTVTSESEQRQHQTKLTNGDEDIQPSALTTEPLLQFAAPEKDTATQPRKQLQGKEQTFGKYQLVWQLSRDALSTTYAARREGIDDLLAVRIFNERVRTDAQVRQIQKAAKSASELTHPHVVVVYESGVGEDGAPYIATDWIEGEDLAQVLQVTKRLDIARFLNVFSQVCDALSEAHSRQLIHGNLSPHKILFANNEEQLDLIKLIDFGMPADPVQNAFYLSPEQCLDRAKVDARADVYSLGCIMYEALVGSPPFVGHKRSQASLNYLHELANQYSPDAPEHRALKLLDCIIVKCLQVNRSKRFASVRELSDALSLVADCICHGSTRKLPHRAEKLLLFRFLDFFDKKIVACMFAYLVIGLGSAKLLSEFQLQKYIDAGQLAVMGGDWSLAQSNRNLAIKQAEWANKPPSLQADLHWELGDTYWQELNASCLPCSSASYNGSGFIISNEVTRRGFNNELAKDAIAEWAKAVKYFQHGAHFRSCTLALWQKIADTWLSLDNRDVREDVRRKVRQSAQTLYDHKKFADCASLCSNYLQATQDKKLATLAGIANMALSLRVPAKQAIRFLERANYFSDCCGGARSVDLEWQIRQLKLVPSPRTRIALASSALEAGDVQAACGVISGLDPGESQVIATLSNFHNLQREAYSGLPVPEKSQALTNGIAALEKVLALQEESAGKHSDVLAPTLVRLAGCYLAAGQNDAAMKTYKKLFELPYSKSNCDDNAALLYTNLLIYNRQSAQAIKFLENKLREPDGSMDTSSGLYIRLIKAYADSKAVRKVHEAVRDITYGIGVEFDDGTKPVIIEAVEPVPTTIPYERIPIREVNTSPTYGWTEQQNTAHIDDLLKSQTPKSDPGNDETGF